MKIGPTGGAATWNLITPGETHYNEVVTRLGHPTMRVEESRAIRNVTKVIHTVWEGRDAPEGYQRVDILFNIDSLFPLLIAVMPTNMSRSQVHKDYGMPERTETTAGGVLVDQYDILGLTVAYQSDGQTTHKMEFFEGVRGRYGR
jgi:hypothetical protein